MKIPITKAILHQWLEEASLKLGDARILSLQLKTDSEITQDIYEAERSVKRALKSVASLTISENPLEVI